MPAFFRRKPRRPRFVPEVGRLEPRELQAIIAGRSTLYAHPAVLPPSGQYVPVHVYGRIAVNRPIMPRGFFVVTDEYRKLEPHGPVALTPAPDAYGFHTYAYSFTVNLQASRSSGTPDGRHYNVFVGAADADTTDGRTVTVLVPKTYTGPARLPGPVRPNHQTPRGA